MRFPAAWPRPPIEENDDELDYTDPTTGPSEHHPARPRPRQTPARPVLADCLHRDAAGLGLPLRPVPDGRQHHQHPAPERTARCRLARPALRHPHRRHRPLGRLGDGARLGRRRPRRAGAGTVLRHPRRRRGWCPVRRVLRHPGRHLPHRPVHRHAGNDDRSARRGADRLQGTADLHRRHCFQ